MAEFHQLPSLPQDPNSEWEKLNRAAEAQSKAAATADLPSLDHLTLADYDQVYEPSDDSYLFLDALLYEFNHGNLPAAATSGNREGARPPFCVLELGCGSGVISTFVRSQWKARFGNSSSLVLQSIVTDVNRNALRVALETDRVNNENNKELSSMEAIHCDLATPLQSRWAGQVDVILFNPPYVPTGDDEVGRLNDISAAWAGGVDGRRVIDRAVPQIAQLLRPHTGVAYVVTVDDNRPPELAQLFRQQQQHQEALQMKPLFRRRARNEYLTIQKISWVASPPSTRNLDVNNNEDTAANPNGVIVVLLVCGLPGSGKSILSRSLKARIEAHGNDGDEVSVFRQCHHIEYDELQDQILEESSEASRPAEGKNDDTLVAWKQSRSVALDQLNNLLQKESQAGHSTKPNNVMIIMDDNFHLRSMRKQIFNVCQEHVRRTARESSKMSAHQQPALALATLWLDAPVGQCVQRNASRPPSTRVSNESIQKIKSTSELPTHGRTTWELNMITLDCGKDGEEELPPLVDQAYQFTKQVVNQDFGSVIQPQPTAEEEDERLERDRHLTLANKSHQFDQASRKWVGAVARIKSKDAKVANQIRKDMIKEFPQIENWEGEGMESFPWLFSSRVWQESDSEWSQDERDKLLGELSSLLHPTTESRV